VDHVDRIIQHAVHEHIGQLREMGWVCVDGGGMRERCEALRLKVASRNPRRRNFGLARYRKALFTRSGGSTAAEEESEDSRANR
jgi:hypothetical protein